MYIYIYIQKKNNNTFKKNNFVFVNREKKLVIVTCLAILDCYVITKLRKKCIIYTHAIFGQAILHDYKLVQMMY